VGVELYGAQDRGYERLVKCTGCEGWWGTAGPGQRGSEFVLFEWLTDPVKNGAGALMDFGCYNALWSLWYMGKPQTVMRAWTISSRSGFQRWRIIDMVWGTKTGRIFEGSWDLPRSFQDLSFRRTAVLTMVNNKVEVRKSGRGATTEAVKRSNRWRRSARVPLAYMANAVEKHQAPDGWSRST